MNDSHPGRGLAFVVLVTMCVLMSTSPSTTGPGSQVPAVNFDIRAAKGLVVSPVYEGWYQLDGTTYVLFGYYNRNLEEVLDIPIGPDNKVEPGPIDQAQPTHFFPGRHHGVFAVAIPKDRPRTEMTWTLSAKGHTLSIPATLDQLYFISPQRDDGGVHPGNTPPLLQFDLSGPSARGPLGMMISRTATVSRALTVDVWVTDTEPPPARAVPVSATSRTLPRGLTVSWRLYRGPGSVSFSNPTPPLEQGKAHTTVTFSEVGDYMLHVLALESRSGTKCCWTNGYVKVAVDAGAHDR